MKQVSTKSDWEIAFKQLSKDIRAFGKKLSTNIIQDFLIESIEYIKNLAKDNIDMRVQHQGQGYEEVINSWDITQVACRFGGEMAYELRNHSEIATYLEFGTGIVGQENKHKTPDSNARYRYDMNEHGEEGWTYYNKEFGILVKGFTGYEGKYYLYDAIWEYFYDEDYQRIFERVLQKYMS